MKQSLILLLACLISSMSYAQIEIPAPSPLAKIEQRVGLTDVSLAYSRPSVKDRTIFGELVPYDTWWRTGANAVSTIEFSKAVIIGGKEVPAGEYSFFSKPGKTEWTVYFYDDLTFFPNRAPESEHIFAQVNVSPMTSSILQESFSVTIENIKTGTADLEISWANTIVRVPIDFGTEAEVKGSISRALSGPSSQDYATAINYELNSNGDLNKALEWADEALAKETSYPLVLAKLNVLHELEQADYSKAFALAVAKEPELSAIDVHQMGRTFMAWGDKEVAYSLFETNAKQHPNTWPVHVGLSRMYSSKGDYKKAIEHAEKAIKNSPNQPNTDALKAAIERLKKGEDINS